MITDKQDITLAVLTGISFILLFGFCTFLVLRHFVKKKRKLLLEHGIRESAFRQELLQAQVEMQEHTFRIISQEIHDNVGQILSLAKVNLNILALEEKASPRILDVKAQVTDAITELRHLSTGYYADTLVNMGLLTAIRKQLQQLERTGLFTVELSADEEEVEVDSNKTLFLYRMVQETLNNVVRHSVADKIWVRVFREEKTLHISIADNGKGFAANEAGFTPGIGLSSICQRAAMIDARVDIHSGPGEGTVVHFLCKTG